MRDKDMRLDLQAFLCATSSFGIGGEINADS